MRLVREMQTHPSRQQCRVTADVWQRGLLYMHLIVLHLEASAHPHRTTGVFFLENGRSIGNNNDCSV